MKISNIQVIEDSCLTMFEIDCGQHAKAVIINKNVLRGSRVFKIHQKPNTTLLHIPFKTETY